jgi:hypothetical protein
MKPAYANPLTTATVVTVGNGRGFVVDHTRERVTIERRGGEDVVVKDRSVRIVSTRLVITAAHCLPFFPPCMNFSYLEERTYKELLGPLGEKPTTWAECLFVDPINDIAVLGPPDDQALPSEYLAYEAFIDAADAFTIAPAPAKGYAWMLSLAGEWYRCAVQCLGGPLIIMGAETAGGMSGSPIILSNGAAIGVVTSSAGGVGGQPNLKMHLPGWALKAIPTKTRK